MKLLLKLVLIIVLNSCSRSFQEEPPIYFFRHFPPTNSMIKIRSDTNGDLVSIGNKGTSKNIGILIKTSEYGITRWELPDGEIFMDFALLSNDILVATLPPGSFLPHSSRVSDFREDLGEILLVSDQGILKERGNSFSDDFVEEILMHFQNAGISQELFYLPLGFTTTSDNCPVFIAEIRPGNLEQFREVISIQKFDSESIDSRILSIPGNEEQLFRAVTGDNNNGLILVASKETETTLYRVDESLQNVEVAYTIPLETYSAKIEPANFGYALYLELYNGDPQILGLSIDFRLLWSKTAPSKQLEMAMGEDNDLIICYESNEVLYLENWNSDGDKKWTKEFCCGTIKDLEATDDGFVILAEYDQFTNYIKVDKEGNIP